MREIRISASRPSTAFIGYPIQKTAEVVTGLCGSEKALIVCDGNTEKFAEKISSSLKKKGATSTIARISVTEKEKTLETVEKIYSECLRAGLDRSSAIVAVGGGALLDTAGFAAATFLRGIKWVAVPTTLLAQVDASIGGKTGVDFEGKNLVGAFHQPTAVITDFSVLRSLPEKELSNGFAEIIKCACISGSGFFSFLEKNSGKIRAREEAALEQAAERAIMVKKSHVEGDEFEALEEKTRSRMFLNFGHTVGHALEKASNYSIPHGHAVSLGMIAALELSKLSEGEKSRITALLKAFGLPTVFPRVQVSKVLKAIASDKKKLGESTRFVFLDGIGKPRISVVSLKETETVLRELIP